MKNERTQYKVTIFGEHYSIVSDESAEHVMNITFYVDSLMKEIATKSTGFDTKKIAVLVALQLASQLVSLRNEKEKNNTKQGDLLNKVEHALSTFIQ